VDSDIILITVEKKRKETCEIRFLVIENSAFLHFRQREFWTSEKRSESRVLSAQLQLVILRHS
jgi:hypothetical protein